MLTEHIIKSCYYLEALCLVTEHDEPVYSGADWSDGSDGIDGSDWDGVVHTFVEESAVSLVTRI